MVNIVTIYDYFVWAVSSSVRARNSCEDVPADMEGKVTRKEAWG